MIGRRGIVKRCLPFVASPAISAGMDRTENLPSPGKSGASAASREERLAAKLRENLRRRKAQARAIDAAEHISENTSGESDALPKTPPES